MSDVAVAAFRPQGITPPTKRTAFRHVLAAEVLQDARSYLTLRADWERLAGLQPGTIVFQTPDLLATWARHFAQRPGSRLATIVVRSENRLVLIWPLCIERRGFVHVATGAGAPISQYDEILIDPDIDAKAVMAAALDALNDAMSPDILLLERVRADGALRAALSHMAPICWAEAAPYLDLAHGMAAAMAGLRRSVVRKQKKRVRRLHREGRVTFAVAATSAEAEAWLAEALALKRSWLRSTGRLSRAFIKSATGECLAELARTLRGADGAPRVVVAKLSLDGRTTAIEAALCHRDVYHLYLRAFAPEFSIFGPGNVLTEYMLGWCADHGMARYDMLAPRSRNKGEWQTNEVAVVDFAVPLTFRGRLYVELVLKRVAPALRTAFYRLPAWMRSAVAGQALRM